MSKKERRASWTLSKEEAAGLRLLRTCPVQLDNPQAQSADRRVRKEEPRDGEWSGGQALGAAGLRCLPCCCPLHGHFLQSTEHPLFTILVAATGLKKSMPLPWVSTTTHAHARAHTRPPRLRGPCSPSHMLRQRPTCPSGETLCPGWRERSSVFFSLDDPIRESRRPARHCPSLPGRPGPTQASPATNHLLPSFARTRRGKHGPLKYSEPGRLGLARVSAACRCQCRSTAVALYTVLSTPPNASPSPRARVADHPDLDARFVTHQTRAWLVGQPSRTRRRSSSSSRLAGRARGPSPRPSARLRKHPQFHMWEIPRPTLDADEARTAASPTPGRLV